MASRRSARRERLRRSESAERIAAERETYFLYGLIALAGPTIGFMYAGIAALGAGAIVSLAVAAYMFRAARAPRVGGPGDAATRREPPDQLAEYERSVRERADRRER
jgi:hypothetical protein